MKRTRSMFLLFCLVSMASQMARRQSRLPQINKTILVDGVTNTTLKDAIASCGNTDPCWIIDTTPETFSSNPFSSYIGPGLLVSLGPGKWTTNAQIILPNFTQVVGSGRGGHASNGGTTIQAGGSFPSGTSVVLLGSSPTGQFGTRLENVAVDCNGAPGGIGVENSSAQEQSGVNHVLVTSCVSMALYWHGGNAQNSGIYDVELLFPANISTTSPTIGIDCEAVPGFRGVHGATVNATGQSTRPASLVVANCEGTYEDFNLENAANGIEVKTSGVEAHNIQDNTNVISLITLDPGVQSFVGTTLINSGTNVVNNLDNGKIYTQVNFPFYFYGIGQKRPELYSMGGSVVSSSLVAKLADQGACTMSRGTCSAQSLSRTYEAPPNCFANWTGEGTLTGFLKVPSSTTTVTPASTVRTDTAQVNWQCVGN